MSEPSPFEPMPETLLGRATLAGRLAGELARLRRSGGFLSLVVLGPAAARTPLPSTLARQMADALRPRVRLHDTLAQLDDAVAIVMPRATSFEASRGAERLLGVCNLALQATDQKLAAGTATVFRDVEGGAAALMAAAQEALESATPGAVKASAHMEGRPWVLIVDDDVPFATMLAESVTQRGWVGHPCTRIEDALRRVAEPTYSALFVDLVLKGGSGVSVLRRAIAASPRRPAALMSGHDAGHAGVLEALELGPVMFVRKPIAGVELDTALAMFRSLLPGAGQDAERQRR